MSSPQPVDDQTAALARSRILQELGISLLLAAIFTTALFLAQGFPRSAAMFPTFVSWVGIALSLINAAINLWKILRNTVETAAAVGTSDLAGEHSLGEVYPYILWIVGAYLGIWLFGFIPAASVFSIAFLFFVARLHPIGIAAMTALSISIVLTLGSLLNVSWPTGIVWQLLP